MAVSHILSVVLVVLSPTYGNSVSEPMTRSACHRAMHETGAALDAMAKMREASLGDDMKTADRDRAIEDFWNFKAHCVPKNHPDAIEAAAKGTNR
jgi:hypothetical protein